MSCFLSGVTLLLAWKERSLFIWLIVVFLIGHIGCPPPRRTDQQVPTNKPNDTDDVDGENKEMTVEYERYLREVVQLLESDPDFRSKLEKSDPQEIRSGNVANQLEFVNHQVRSKLDELKRQELDRLVHSANQMYEHERGLDIPYDGRHKIPGHLDHSNPTFEVEDLRRLIIQTTRDLEESDRKRKEAFKEYEMRKEFDHQEKLEAITDVEKRKAEERAWEEVQKKHAEHPKIHHPGSKQQLEKVWEEQDQLERSDFNPKAFFALHDLDGNSVWDHNEVKALFGKELDKAYDRGVPEADMNERSEEMERMREHVFKEMDTDRNSLISLSEFLEQTRKEEFQSDPAWNTIKDEQPVYSQQEYKEFENRRQLEIKQMIERGVLPPHPGMPMPHNSNAQYGMPPMPGQYGVPQQPYYPPQPMAIPQKIPGKQITPDQAVKLQQQQPTGQPPKLSQPSQNQPQVIQQQQYADQQQVRFAQQPYVGQPQQGQYIQQPYAGQQAQFAQPPYPGQQQAQFAQPRYADQQAQFAQQKEPYAVQQQAQFAQPPYPGQQQAQFAQPHYADQQTQFAQQAVPVQQPVQTNPGQTNLQPVVQQNIQTSHNQPVSGQQQQQVPVASPVAQQEQQNQQPIAGQQPMPSVNIH